MGSLTAVALVVCATGVAAQGSLDWLTGTWMERHQSKTRVANSPKTLKVSITDSVLRIVDTQADGNDLQCRLDGTETRSTQTKSRTTVGYALKCKLGARLLEIRGRANSSGGRDFPPQEFEIEEKYELTKDGSLSVRTRIRGFVKPLGDLDLLDERAEFVRAQ